MDWSQAAEIIKGIGAVVGVVTGLPIAGILSLFGIAKFTPNKVLLSWGRMIGRWISKTGRAKFGVTSWESIEPGLLGGIASIAEGIRQGAAQDNPGGLKLK